MFPTNAPADDAPAVDQHTAAENGASHGSNASAFSNASVAEQLVSLVSNTVGARGSLLLVLLSQTWPHDTRMHLQIGTVTAGRTHAAVGSPALLLDPHRSLMLLNSCRLSMRLPSRTTAAFHQQP